MPFEPMHALNDGLCFDSAASCGLWPHLDPRAALAETGSPARFGAWGGSRQGEHPPQSPQPQGLDGKTPPKPLKGGCPPDRVLGSGYRVVRMSAAPCGCGKAIIGDGEGGRRRKTRPPRNPRTRRRMEREAKKKAGGSRPQSRSMLSRRPPPNLRRRLSARAPEMRFGALMGAKGPQCPESPKPTLWVGLGASCLACRSILLLVSCAIQKGAEGLDGLLVARVKGMAVCVQGHAGRAVSQAGLNRLDVRVCPDEERRLGVPEHVRREALVALFPRSAPSLAVNVVLGFFRALSESIVAAPVAEPSVEAVGVEVIS